jgi:translation elongation factor EF-Tu-like GTPase
MRSPKNSEWIVSLRSLPASEGGRRTPFHHGYRLGMFFDGTGGYDAILDIGNVSIKPGESALVRIHVLSPDLVPAFVGVGTRFLVREGHQIVAEGIIEEF